MSSRKPSDFLAAQVKAAARINAGSPEPAKPPRTLPWAQIETITDLFQQRRISEEDSRLHVQELARAINIGPRGAQQANLAPITVFWMGAAWVCVDGHHRLMAYRGVNHPRPVPVQVMRAATLEQAINASLGTNSKTQKELSPTCRTEAAWRLNLAGGRSKDTIATLAGVSDKSVANMRKALREFRAAQPEADPTEFTWAKMRFWRANATGTERDLKEANLRMAEQFLRKVEKHLKGLSPAVLLMALDLHRPGMVNELMEAHSGAMECTGYRGLPFPGVPNNAPMDLRDPSVNPDF